MVATLTFYVGGRPLPMQKWHPPSDVSKVLFQIRVKSSFWISVVSVLNNARWNNQTCPKVCNLF